MKINSTKVYGFENTEIAFKSRTDRDLRRAWLMFKAISHPFLVKAGKVLINVMLRSGIPLGWLIKPTVYRHFVGGENIAECTKNVRRMAQFGVRSILDYSVESRESPDEIRHSLDETLKTIKNAADDPDIPFAVFKPTAFINTAVLEKISSELELNYKEKLETANFRQRVELLCQTAFYLDVPILIDAEDCRYQDFFDSVVTEMSMKFNRTRAIVYNTLQMYRTDRLVYLKKAFSIAEEGNYYLGMKFVRGAYMERERARASKMNYPSPIHKDKESTDRDYNLALEFSAAHNSRISIFNGTHNEQSIRLLTELMKKYGIRKDDPGCYFSQLYGMSDHISFNLALEGYNVAKYLPYGPVKHVLPYLIRRVEENTSVAGQTGRELKLIRAEMKRRKNLNKNKN